jgi:hypothetical protein
MTTRHGSLGEYFQWTVITRHVFTVTSDPNLMIVVTTDFDSDSVPDKDGLNFFGMRCGVDCCLPNKDS